MDTVKIDENNIDQRIIEKAARILKNGGLVAFPTETVYGLGADALNPLAAQKIYEAKGRPADNPLIVHIKAIEDLPPLVKRITPVARKLTGKFWPGPLTIILEKNENIPSEVSGGLDAIAVRLPGNAIARTLIAAVGSPIAAPSANLSGRPSPTKASHVAFDLSSKIDMLIDGGSSVLGLESTIIDLTLEPPLLLRPGSITKEMLENEIGTVLCQAGQGESAAPKAPGMKYKHYAPNAEVVIVKGCIESIVAEINRLALQKNTRIGIIATEQTKHLYQTGIVLSAGDRNHPETIGANIFSILRKFDNLCVDMIFAEAIDETGIGAAIMNRLSKAAEYHILQA